MENRHSSSTFASACSRRAFLAAAGLSTSALAFPAFASAARDAASVHARPKDGALVRAVFVYPPSATFADPPDGWWSWPGNEYDAEGRQRQYTDVLKGIERDLGMRIAMEPGSIGTDQEAAGFAQSLQESKPDGLLIVMFYNGSLKHADEILKAAEALGIPAVFYIGLGVKHGAVADYRRPGVYFIQALDDFDAIRLGMRMINTRKLLAQSRVLSITDGEAQDAAEPFFGIQVKHVPFQRYADAFAGVQPDASMRAFIRQVRRGAKEIRGVSGEAFENAARAHFALLRLLDEEEADGLTMNCLRRGMLKPCISFSMLNSALVPAACENDLPALYTQLLGQLLTGRPGFQHNPCYETERNHYYASHCTCPAKLEGPDGKGRPYLLRRFAHTNEGSCAIQVFWKPGAPVTMARYYPGEKPSLDVYAGRVVASHPMPPAAGCTTNVEIELSDRRDACMVRGHHNLLFCGGFARSFRLFALLHRIPLADTGFEQTWPLG